MFLARGVQAYYFDDGQPSWKYHTREHIHIIYMTYAQYVYMIYMYMNICNYDQIGEIVATMKALRFHLCC